MLTGVLAIFLIGLVAPWVDRLLPDRAGWVLAIVPAAVFVYFTGFLPDIAAGGTVRHAIPWVPGVEAMLSFYLDGLSLMFALLICGIGTFIIIYSGGYLHGHEHLGRFYLYMLAFMGSMLGLVLADNIVTLFIFWELTSVTSYLLIGYNHRDPSSRRSALQALLVTGAGGLIMLAGLIMMAYISGTFELSEMITGGDMFREHAHYVPILLLVLAGTFTKSAQFPFHFWLPNAMDAPTPVSAFLHSATMVKAGVYLMARLNPALGGTELWMVLLVGFGAVTALLGAVLAVRQTDLKRILAYTTVTVLGQLTMLIGAGTDYAMQAFAAYLLAHSLYKGCLFMGAGAVDHETGTRDVTKLGGLLKLMPVTAAAVGLAALSNAGLPPFLGFIAKEFQYAGVAALGGLGWVVVGMMVLTNGLLLVTAGLVAIKPFLGRRGDFPKPHVHEAPISLWLGPITLAVLGLVFGLFSMLPETYLVAPTVLGVAGPEVAVNLYLWGGFTLPLLLSAVTVALGVVLFLNWPRLKERLDALARALRYDSERGYDATMQGLVTLSVWQARKIQSGYLRNYILALFTVSVVAVVGTMILKDGFAANVAFPRVDVASWVLSGLIVISAMVTVLARSRLAGILSLGVVGLSIALVFLIYGAADVAITQFMVETLLVIIVVLVLARLPRFSRKERSSRMHALRDGMVAVATGAMVTAVMLSVLSAPMDFTLSEYFNEKSYTEAFGRNIVNVILVDFRALDTLGEIVVVAVAGFGAFALLKARAFKARRTSDRGGK